jgi:hypothetical protein
MSAVPGFRHDIFVSYAHLDDAASAMADRGFVSQLVADIKDEVSRKIGGAALEIWWDRSALAGNMSVTPEITTAASQAAAIVIVLSRAYLRSEWCRRERSTFLTSLQRRAGEGALFIVAIDSLARETLPDEFKELPGHDFWKSIGNGKATRQLRADLDVDEKKIYHDQLCILATGIAEYLDALSTVRPVAAPSGPALLLAEVTDDLVSRRNEVKSYLEQLGFTVLPRRRYSHDKIETHRQQLRDDLAQSRLFVQLLGPLAGDKEEEPKGMAWLRYSIAREALPAVPIIQWRDPQLQITDEIDSDARDLLELPTVRRCGLQELKSDVAKLMQIKPRERTAPPAGATKCVFVVADLLDKAFANEVAAWLADQGFIVLVPPATADIKEWQAECDSNLEFCESLVLVYGQTKPSWVTQRFLQSRKVLAIRPKPIELLAICVGPPPATPDVDKLSQLSLRYGKFEYLHCESGLNVAEMSRFATLLGAEHAD